LRIFIKKTLGGSPQKSIRICNKEVSLRYTNLGLGSCYQIKHRHIFVHVPNQGLDFQRHMSCRRGFCAQRAQLRWEVTVCFVDIGGTDHHHCLKSIFITEMRCNLFRYTPIILIRRKQLNIKIGFKRSFTFYVDVFFPLSLTRLLPDLTIYMSNTAGVLSEAGTTYLSRAPEFTPGFFRGVRVAHLFRFLCCPIMCLRSKFRLMMSVPISV